MLLTERLLVSHSQHAAAAGVAAADPVWLCSGEAVTVQSWVVRALHHSDSVAGSVFATHKPWLGLPR